MLNRDEFVSALISGIEGSLFTPTYRKRVIGEGVLGWQARLDAYFWPTPAISKDSAYNQLRPLLERGRRLAEARGKWTNHMSGEAVSWANAVLKWGGVPQKIVTAQIVGSVIDAAMSRNPNLAPMNSGWTKVAAFATAHLEREGGANAIWDSRVSWSIVRRADEILFDAGLRSIPLWLSAIGKVPGRGGTRWSHQLKLPWPMAYRLWDSHFAATDLIHDIRDELNRSDWAKSSNRSGPAEIWTTRSVEMVLFMDGY